MTDETSKRIGDYQILDELGSGGMGRVWRVRNVITDRVEAMKVLLPDLAGRQELAARFQREIKLMASLNHPNIAALRTAFTADNQLYMVMEYVEGSSVADQLERGAIPVSNAVDYIRQVLDAVSYAHKQNVIHRDIKPANMMLTPQGVIKLMDFGIARAGEDRSLTMTGTTMGSLSYMSPEQVKGEPTDARSDLYSVGVSLYEMVTGQRPFVATSDYSIMAAHVKEAPKPPVELHPGLPAALNEIILMSIAKDPALRFQTADAFRNALSSVPVTASPVVSQSALDASTVTSIPVPATQTAAALPTPPTGIPSRPVAPPTTAPSAKAPSPVPTPSPMPPPVAQPSGHRGLYMTLGALIVLAVLVVAGIYVPKSSWTHAKSPDASTPARSMGDNTATQSSSDQSAASQSPSGQSSPRQSSEMASPTAVPSTSPADSAAAMMNSSPTPPVPPAAPAASVDNSNSMQQMPPSAMSAPKSSVAHHARKLAAQNSMAGEAPASAQGGEAAPDAGNSAQLDELEKTVDQLSNRAAAVNSGLDRLQQQQAASGYGLRGDMVERQASLKSNLYKAEEALQHRDLARAKKFADLAEGDAGVLERFLGH
jgi:serine/threonine protein kinase